MDGKELQTQKERDENKAVLLEKVRNGVSSSTLFLLDHVAKTGTGDVADQAVKLKDELAEDVGDLNEAIEEEAEAAAAEPVAEPVPGEHPVA